jgi:hypothetical protein
MDDQSFVQKREKVPFSSDEKNSIFRSFLLSDAKGARRQPKD